MSYHFRNAPTERQITVLAAARDLFGERMPHTALAINCLGQRIGVTYPQAVRDSLFALRAKGLIASEGRLLSRPEAWLLFLPQDHPEQAAGPQDQTVLEAVLQDTAELRAVA